MKKYIIDIFQTLTVLGGINGPCHRDGRDKWALSYSYSSVLHAQPMEEVFKNTGLYTVAAMMTIIGCTLLLP